MWIIKLIGICFLDDGVYVYSVIVLFIRGYMRVYIGYFLCYRK